MASGPDGEAWRPAGGRGGEALPGQGCCLGSAVQVSGLGEEASLQKQQSSVHHQELLGMSPSSSRAGRQRCCPTWEGEVVKALGSNMDATRDDHTGEVSQTEKDEYYKINTIDCHLYVKAKLVEAT